MIGTTLSHYRITEKLGAGGMGVVYRAEDMNLNRQVAIKVLPDIFAGDPERLARFEREAKLLASLNHPNIATIYGLEQADGKRFLAMELVEGETLAQRIAKGPLPVEEALDVCRQIAEGLEAAHEKGIIHRDLKPANVKITPEGKVKVLDFGLAKALQGEIAVADASHSPTLTDQMTHPGVILGTAVYMSPEQAKGKSVDKRADIWAFGCVLYECVTGQKAFQGDTITETVAAILKSEPDWTLLAAETPALVRSLLRRCLQKDPNIRLHDIADARVEMTEGLSESAEATTVIQRSPLRWVALIGTAALLIGVLIGLGAMWFLRPEASLPPQVVVRALIRLGPGLWLDGRRQTPPRGFDQPTRTAMAISNDGRFLVYSTIKENPGTQDRPCLYMRKLDELQAKPIAGTEGGISPFLSPDDRWVGFWADGRLKKVSVDGGVPTELCDVPLPFGFDWGEDNRIVFAGERSAGLLTISAGGGKPEMLTVFDKSNEEYSHRLPHYLPDGKGIVFTITRHSWDWQPRVAVLDLVTRKWRILLEDAADARYIPTGYLAFLHQGKLMLVPFDANRLEITGQPFPVIDNIAQALNATPSDFDTAAGQFSISASGSLVYATGGMLQDMENSLVWVDHKGIAEPIASFKAAFSQPRLSPDGLRIAYFSRGKSRQVYTHDLNRGTTTKLTSEGLASYPVWTPDSRRLVFSWSKTGTSNLHWQPADGSSPIERLTTSEYTELTGSWSPDGEILAFVETRPETSRDIMLLHLRDRKVTPFLHSRFNETHPEFSPDGRWIAYVSNEWGRDEVYVQPFPGPGGKSQISNEGGTEPLWSRNGKQLFYRRADQVWVVDIQIGSAFSVSKPRLVFEQPGYMMSTAIRCWDISLDGQRFLMVREEQRKSTPVTEMILVQNWFEELKRLVPSRK